MLIRTDVIMTGVSCGMVGTPGTVRFKTISNRTAVSYQAISVAGAAPTIYLAKLDACTGLAPASFSTTIPAAGSQVSHLSYDLSSSLLGAQKQLNGTWTPGALGGNSGATSSAWEWGRWLGAQTFVWDTGAPVFAGQAPGQPFGVVFDFLCADNDCANFMPRVLYPAGDPAYSSAIANALAAWPQQC